MGKTWEDCFSELQADMISICLEYAKEKVDTIYIYCSFEDMVISCDFFYCINGKIVRKHKLNDAISDESCRYDTSVARQEATLDMMTDDIQSLYQLCKEYKKEMPTEMKLIYDATKNSVKADYKYDLVYTEDPQKTADDIVAEWFAELKVKKKGRK